MQYLFAPSLWLYTPLTVFALGNFVALALNSVAPYEGFDPLHWVYYFMTVLTQCFFVFYYLRVAQDVPAKFMTTLYFIHTLFLLSFFVYIFLFILHLVFFILEPLLVHTLWEYIQRVYEILMIVFCGFVLKATFNGFGTAAVK